MGKKVIPDIDKKADMYFQQNMSLTEIAKEYGTYPKKIERELKSAGFTLRGRSAAQKIRLDEGKAEHPTAGKERDEATKEKISNAVHASWQDIDDEERERRSEIAREIMNNRKDKDEVIRKGFEAIKETSQHGSALERFLADKLNEHGYYVLVHQKHMIGNNNMHLDILMPKNRIALEIDGPSHYSSVWGEDALEKTIARDSKKNGLLNQEGLHVIRLRQPSAVSDYFKRAAWSSLESTIKELEGASKAQVITLDPINESK